MKFCTNLFVLVLISPILIGMLVSCGKKNTISINHTAAELIIAKNKSKSPPKISPKTNITNSTKKSNETVIDFMANTRFKNFVLEWLNVKYKFGGKDKSGIDCSNFSCKLLRDVFDFGPNYYAPSYELAKQVKVLEPELVEEGDFVFFSFGKSGNISHVGIMIDSEFFIHASSSKGVVINSIHDNYYKGKIVMFGANPKIDRQYILEQYNR